jgi:hypothetical protein
MRTSFLTYYIIVTGVIDGYNVDGQDSISGIGTNFDFITMLYIQISSGFHPEFHLVDTHIWVTEIKQLEHYCHQAFPNLFPMKELLQ